jgi:hypothetical protein
METPRTNIQRLAEEGFTIQTDDLPQEYEDVIEGLGPDEIELIIDVTRRLERARESIGGEPHFGTFFPPF